MRMDTKDMVRWYNIFHNGIEAVVLKCSRDREALTLTHVEHWSVFNYDDEDSCLLRAFCARHCPCYKHLAWIWFIHLSKLLRNCYLHFINKEGKVEDEVVRPVTFSKYHKVCMWGRQDLKLDCLLWNNVFVATMLCHQKHTNVICPTYVVSVCGMVYIVFKYPRGKLFNMIFFVCFLIWWWLCYFMFCISATLRAVVLNSMVPGPAISTSPGILLGTNS